MKKICLVLVGLYLHLLSAFTQTVDSSSYKKRKLTLDEINFVSGYYHQDGDNSAITGGVGTQKLSDFSNTLEVKLVKQNKQKNKITLDFNLGVDYYTSASSDKIDPFTISSASSEDLRIYPSFSRTSENQEKGVTKITTISFSNESDYQSYGIGVGFSKKSKNNSRVVDAKLQCYFDRVKIILPIELRTESTGGLPGADNEYDYPWKSRNTFDASFSLSQIANQKLQAMLLLDLVYQQGFLSLPFHRVYLNTNELRTENLPGSRFKIPLGVRANYFLMDKLILRSFYRFYIDTWGIKSHTAEVETVVKFTPFFSLTPFYRYHHQSASDYFAPYLKHTETESFYTSNYDLSKLDSHFFGAGLRLSPPFGILKSKHWQSVELRYGHYQQNNGLIANTISVHVGFK